MKAKPSTLKYLPILCILFIFNTGQAQQRTVKYDKITEHGSTVGYVDETGKWAIKPKFIQADPFSGPGFDYQYAIVAGTDGSQRLIDKTGNTVINMTEYRMLGSIGSSKRFRKGMKIYTKKDNAYHGFILDVQNAKIFWLPDETAVADYLQPGTNFIVIKTPWSEYNNDKVNYGIVTLDLKIAVPAVNHYIAFENGFIQIQKGGLTAIYDSTVNKVIDFKYKEVKAEPGGKSFIAKQGDDEDDIHLDAQGNVLKTQKPEIRPARSRLKVSNLSNSDNSKMIAGNLVESVTLDKAEAIKMLKAIGGDFKDYLGEQTGKNDSITFYDVNNSKIWARSQSFNRYGAGLLKGVLVYRAYFKDMNALAMGGAITQLGNSNDPDIKIIEKKGDVSNDVTILYKGKVSGTFVINFVSNAAELVIGDLLKK